MVLSHSVAPFDLSQFAPVASLIPPRTQEPAVAAPNVYARELALLGYPGPYTLQGAPAAVVAASNGKPLDLAMPGDDGPANRRRRAALTCLALNRLCEFDAAATEHGPMADAAE